MNRFVSAIAAVALGVVLAPQALAATTVQGGPLTGLSLETTTNIHLVFSGYPKARGLYVFQAVKPAAGARPTVTNAATQLWLSADTSGGASSIKGDVVLVVDNGHSWGADCAHQECGIFIRLDHTASSDTSEDQFIPLTFAPSTATSTNSTPSPTSSATPATPALPADTIAVTVNGKALVENAVGAITYRAPLTFAVTTGSGATATLKSYTPDLCPVNGNVVDALKGSGTCDIAVTSPGDAMHSAKTAHFPLIISPATQSLTVTSASVKVGKTLALESSTAFGEKITYVTGSKNCSVKGNSIKGLKAGICSITATAPGTANYSALSANVVVTVKK